MSTCRVSLVTILFVFFFVILRILPKWKILLPRSIQIALFAGFKISNLGQGMDSRTFWVSFAARLSCALTLLALSGRDFRFLSRVHQKFAFVLF